MHVTLSQLKAYHAKLKLAVGHCELTIIFPERRRPLRWTVLCVQDHLDPFWWSQHPLGGCEDGATAPNMSASAWHFAGRQIGKGDSVAGTLASFLQRQVVLAGELGLEMQLIVKWINGADNVYTPEFAFDQNQVLPPTASGHPADVSSRWLLRILFSPRGRSWARTRCASTESSSPTTTTSPTSAASSGMGLTSHGSMAATRVSSERRLSSKLFRPLRKCCE